MSIKWSPDFKSDTPSLEARLVNAEQLRDVYQTNSHELRAQLAEAHRALELAKEALCSLSVPHAPLFPACCDLKSQGHRSGCVGRVYDAALAARVAALTAEVRTGYQTAEGFQRQVAALRSALLEESGPSCNLMGCKHSSCAALADTAAAAEVHDTRLRDQGYSEGTASALRTIEGGTPYEPIASALADHDAGVRAKALEEAAALADDEMAGSKRNASERDAAARIAVAIRALAKETK